MKLALFDVDGTLVDSQGDIVGAMQAAFASVEAPLPDRRTLLSIVGLSLPIAMARLAPDQTPDEQAKMVAAYKAHYASTRGEATLYPGARDALSQVNARDDWLLGIATGKSRRGLTRLLERADLGARFVTTQVADDHPSKPHPSMIETALAETDVAPGDAVMIGDTTFDMLMAQAAGVPFIAVSWGYHPVASLAQARVVLTDFAELPAALEQMWGSHG